MTDRTAIANQALLMLGENTISSFSEESTEARAAAAFYEDARDFALRDIKPAFARRRVAVNGTVLPVAAGTLPYQYMLPEDCCVALTVGSHWSRDIQWTVEGRTILTDKPIEWLVYVSRDDDVEATMDGAFVKALVAYLAQELAYALIGDKNRANELMDIYSMRSSEARVLDGLQGATQLVYNDELALVR